MIERRADDRFAHRIARALDVGRLAKKKAHALSADLRDAGKVDLIPRDGREIDLEIAAVENFALRRVDRQRYGTRDRMVHVDEFYAETTQFDLVSRSDADELRLVDPLFAQFVVRQREGEFGAVDGLRNVF